MLPASTRLQHYNLKRSTKSVLTICQKTIYGQSILQSKISSSRVRVPKNVLPNSYAAGTIEKHLPAIICCHFSAGRPKKPFTSNRLSFGAGAAALSGITLLSKGKGILAALKLTKFASLGSMLLTVGTYSAFYGLPYAAGMVGLILVHESGHALVMRHLKVPFSPMVFVPFMGAAVAMKKQPKNAYEEALIALGGPVLGTVGAMGVWGGGFALNSQLCFALADFGFMINLFNLIPIGMLDGGRIGNALSPYAGVIGVGVSGSMIALGQVSNPIFYLITLAGSYQTGMRLYNNYIGYVDPSIPRNYYNISSAQRMRIGAGYFGLLGVLFTTMAVNERYKKSPERLMYEQRAQNAVLPGTGLSNHYRDY